MIARQLGHSDTRMTERHYAHLAPNYVADTIRASFPRLRKATTGRYRSCPTEPQQRRLKSNFF